MTPHLLQALRDPAGVPSPPLVFLILGVATFALHIAAVQVMFGASALALRGAYSQSGHWRRLGATMLFTAKVAVSVAIVLGVAPLLFIQVIYDPFWYTSNVLSAWWVVGFIGLLIGGYIALYVFYWTAHRREAPGGRNALWMALSLGLLLAVGFIVHSLTYQMLFPERWMTWYAPGGTVQSGGHALHGWHLWRFSFFLALSIPVTGAWLHAHRRYLRASVRPDEAYLAWLAPLADRLLLAGGVVSVALGALWMGTLPPTMSGFARSPWPLAALLALAAAIALPRLLQGRLDRGYWGYAVFAAAAGALVVVAAAREALRYATLDGAHGYAALDYRVSVDWYSTILFFATFGVLGTATLGYLLTVAWQASQGEGVYTPSPAVNRLGSAAVGLLALWILAYFAVGFWVWAR
ncbi:MAG: hypothetical protein WC713_09315 [Candidatus Methylomirabilota bacterium]